MKRRFNRIIALVSAAALLSTCAPVAVFADEFIDKADEFTDQADEFIDNGDEIIAEDEEVEVAESAEVEARTEVEVPADETGDVYDSDEPDDFDFVPGYVPAPYEDDYENVDLGETDSFAAYTDRKYISPIARQFPTRSQNPYGTCWAFASVAAAEMSAAKNGVIMPGGSPADASTDLSELHLVYFGGNGLEVYDPLNGMSGDKNGVPAGKTFLDNGGSADNAAHLLSSWIGTADESKYAYTNASTAYSTDRTNSLDDVLHLKNYYAVEHRTNRDAVKKLITDYGMVTTSYYGMKRNSTITVGGVKVSFADVYSSDYNCFYMPLKSGANHAVSIIGWDDDFSKEKFAYSTKPEGDGAWLIRNSWTAGVKVDENGNPIDTTSKYETYFWISYYDMSMRDTCYAFEMEPLNKYDNNYQYDGAMTGKYCRKPTSYANIFTVNGNAEILDAVYFSTHSANVDYTIDVYTGVSSGKPTEGTHVVKGQTGTTTYAGGYTIELNTPVDLKKGDTFSVIISIPADATLDIESTTTDNYNTTAYTVSGRSLYSFGKTWTDSSKVAEGCGDFRIKAFTVNAVPITFNANGGKIGSDATETKNYRTGSKYGEMPVPGRTGYDFAGWFTAATEGEKVTAEDIVSTEKTLYARWTPKKFKVTFDPDGGTCAVASAEVEYDSTYGKASPLPVPEKSGYGFDGWYTAKSGGTRVTDETIVSITADQTLYAHWDANKYTVTFDGNGGTPSESSKAVTYGSKYGTLPSATRPGYKFDGWFTEQTGGTKITNTTIVSIASAHTLYAQWSVCTYTVTLDADGGSFGSAATKTITVTYGGKYGELSEPARTGYDFDGWYTEKTGGTRITADSTVEIGSNHRLYARWDGHFFDITLDPQGGQSATAAINVKNGTPYGQLPVPEKEGSDFVGWYTGATAGRRVTGDTIVDITSPITLYARWDVKKIRVTLDANGGSYGDSTSMQVYVDWGDRLSEKDLTKPSRRRFDFTKWYTDSACTVLFDFNTVLKNDQTIYAGWMPSTFTGFRIEDLDSSRYEYNGNAIKPYFTVYHYEDGAEKRLNYGTDYSVTYTNNVNAGKGDKTGKTGPCVTVKGRGNYSDTLSEGFDIDAVDMSTVYMDIDSAVAGGMTDHHLEFVYNGKAQTLDPVLKADLSSGKTVTLKKGTDYVFKQNGSKVDSVKAAGEYDITVQGIGNYTGTRELKVEVAPAGTKSFAKVNLPSIPNQILGNEYDGYAFILAGEPAAGEKRAVDRNGNPFEWVLTDSSVKPAYVMQYGKDYDLSYSDNTDAGTATVTVIGKGNYAGMVTRTFKIAGIAMSKVTVPKTFEASTEYKKYYDNSSKKFNYTGEEFEVAGPANIGKDKWNNETYGITLYDGGKKLDKGDDYTVTYLKNTEPGTASVIFTGKGKYSGSVRKTFGIQGMDLNANIEGFRVKVMTPDGLIEWDNSSEVEFSYIKGGVKPVPVVMFEDEILAEGVDYRLSWSNYSKPAKYNETSTRGKSIAPTVTITGKGYFKNKLTRTYTIKKGEFDDSLAASDVAYVEDKAGLFTKTKISCDGQELRSGTDFYSLTDTTNTKFTFESFDNDDTKTTGFVTVKDGKSWVRKAVSAGDTVEKTYCIQPGTKIKVSITGKGNFAGQKAETTFGFAANDFSKVSVKINNIMYTGREITYADVVKSDEGGLTVTLGDRKLEYGEDYRISYMSDARKVGTVKVTVKGNPAKGYAGEKTVTFRIVAKPIK
ncbi:MAG: InlB B-repeat-containing protein [Lachnospiraceae bacterium]|nr:InlB B-repeat-containing protein [Lachnospiraceae bacterium]